MWLVNVQMRGSVAINYIFNIIWRRYGPKRYILDYLLGEQNSCKYNKDPTGSRIRMYVKPLNKIEREC